MPALLAGSALTRLAASQRVCHTLPWDNGRIVPQSQPCPDSELYRIPPYPYLNIPIDPNAGGRVRKGLLVREVKDKLVSRLDKGDFEKGKGPNILNTTKTPTGVAINTLDPRSQFLEIVSRRYIPHYCNA